MRTLALFALLVSPAAVLAQRDAKVPDPDPELERKTFVVADGFEVNLFAADPLLAKPIQMNFDSRGRLWVAASEVYPQIRPGQAANDKVLILEDTDNDGKADKTTVFADGLLIPTGVAPGDGGAYVADSTDVVHFSDPDPATGKARKKRVVLSGFGTEDTHHIIHTFRWGPDAHLYMSQSIYIHSHVETPHGVKRLNAGGIWRFDPRTSKLDVFARGWVNSWGTAWDKHGATFATDGAGGEGINYVVPGAYYTAAQGSNRILPGLNPGSPKHCGLEIMDGRHLPDDCQGDMLTNDFRGHRVCRFEVKPDGAGFTSREKTELIKSSHPAFRPIDVKMGPDGAVYIADWYNPIIQHGEVDFHDPRRDRTHGRIWRVTAKGRKLVDKPKIEGASATELVRLLEAPEQWTRTQAKRALVERGPDAVMPELGAWIAGLARKVPESEHARREAVWLCQGLGAVDSNRLARVLLSYTPEARSAACRVAGAWAGQLDSIPVSLTRPTGVVEALAPLVTDDHPRVRLEAVRALAEVGTPAAAEAAAAALDKPLDRWLEYAVWLTLRDLAPVWLPEVRAGKHDFGGDPAKLLFALDAAGTSDVAGPLTAMLKSGKLAPGRRPEVLAALARFGGPADLAFVVQQAVDLVPDARGRVLTAVADTARARKVAAGRADVGPALAATLDGPAGLARQAACRLAGAWKQEQLRPALEVIAAGPADTHPDERRAACDGLASLGGAASVTTLTAVAGPTYRPDARATAAAALAALDVRAAAAATADLLAATPAPTDPAALVGAFTERKGAAAEFAKALAGKQVPADVAKAGLRVAKAAGQPDANLVAALTAAAGLTAPKRDWTKADVDRLAAEALKSGDAARGERVFRRAELQCQKCHAVAGAGGAVGPDLSSLGAASQPDYVVESLLLPSAKVKEGYHSLVVQTTDGKAVTGIKVRESATQLVLRDADDKEVTLRAGDIEDKKEGRSLMPEGLLDGLTAGEFSDLARFLMALGRSGEGYAPAPNRTVRRWQAAEPGKALDAVAAARSGAAAPGQGLQWAPAYALVSGDLPLDALPTAKGRDGGPVAVVTFDVEVTTAGRVGLTFNDPAGVTVWADGKPLAGGATTTADLPAGVRTVTLLVRPAQRTTPLRVELADVPGSPARARVVGGR